MAEEFQPTVAVFGGGRFIDAAADAIAERIRRCLASRGACRLVLAGGGTPKPVYEALVTRPGISWADVEFLWGDERTVGPEHEQSNYRMAQEALLGPIGAPPERVFRIEAERSPAQACEAYERVLERGALDMVLLGMGGDGHTASLFPGDEASQRSDARVLVTNSPKPPPVRISLSIPALRSARHVVMLVAGAGKAERLAQVWADAATDAPQYPAAAVRPPDGEWLWLLDDAAARKLPPNIRSTNEETQ